MISVIMPVLNGENIIRNSINSILNQTYRDWELIIVDNNSTDRTSDVCKHMMILDKRIKYLFCKTKGVVAARIKGVFAARGNYISFLDADDRMKPHMLEYLVKACEDNNADIASCGYINVIDSKNQCSCIPDIEGVCDENIFFECLFRIGTLGFLWNKLYRKSVYMEAMQPLDMDVCEDLCINCLLMLKSRKIVVLRECLYEYFENNASVTHTMERKIDRDNNWKYLKAYKKIEMLCKTDKNKARKIHESQWWIIKLGVEELNKVNGYDLARQKLFEEMKNTIVEVLFSKASLRFKWGYLKVYLCERLKG